MDFVNCGPLERDGMRDELFRSQIDSCSAEEATKNTVTDAIELWRECGCVDFGNLLESHPQIMNEKSLLLELAYEAYCSCRENGTVFDIVEITSLVPAIRDSLFRRIEVDEFLRAKLSGGPRANVLWPKVGDLIAGLRIVEQIGHGGVARVFLCEDEAVGNRQVILKLSAKDAFEANVMGNLSHNNIMPVLSAVHDDERGLSCLCMPFFGRSTLRDVIDHVFRDSRPNSGDDVLQAAVCKTKPTDKYRGFNRANPIDFKSSYEVVVLSIAVQLADALCHAHQVGITHGDLKPSNVVITPDGFPLLMDFNLAEIRSKSNNAVGGTLPYMPPERIIALMCGCGVGGVGETADVYSFGVMLFELLVGQNPFADIQKTTDAYSAMSHVLYRQQDQDRLKRLLGKEFNTALMEIVATCLSFDVSRRPRSMHVLRDALLRELQVDERSRGSVTRRKIAGIVSFSAIAWMISISSRSLFKNYAYRSGVQFFLAREFRAARDSFEDCIMKQGGSFETHFAVACAGLHEYHRSQDSQILNVVERHLRLAARFSNDPRVLLGFSEVHLAKLQYQLAVDALEKVIDKGLESIAIWNNLAYSYLGLSREFSGGFHCHCLRKSLDAIERSLGFDSSKIEPRFNHAIIELALHRATRGDFVPENGLESIRIVASSRPVEPVLFCGACLSAIVAQNGNHDARSECFRYLKRCQEIGVQIDSFIKLYPNVLGDLPVEPLMNDTIPSSVSDDSKINRVMFSGNLLAPNRLDV